MLSIIAMSLLFFYPIAIIESSAQSAEYWLSGIKNVDSGELVLATWPVMILAVIVILISVITVFIYKKRVVQMRLSVYNILLIIGMLAIAILFGKQGSELINGQISLEYFSVMPGIAIIFNFLAWRGIRRDYLMLKAVDRIR